MKIKKIKLDLAQGLKILAIKLYEVDPICALNQYLNLLIESGLLRTTPECFVFSHENFIFVKMILHQLLEKSSASNHYVDVSPICRPILTIPISQVTPFGQLLLYQQFLKQENEPGKRAVELIQIFVQHDTCLKKIGYSNGPAGRVYYGVNDLSDQGGNYLRISQHRLQQIAKLMMNYTPIHGLCLVVSTYLFDEQCFNFRNNDKFSTLFFKNMKLFNMFKKQVIALYASMPEAQTRFTRMMTRMYDIEVNQRKLITQMICQDNDTTVEDDAIPSDDGSNDGVPPNLLRALTC